MALRKKILCNFKLQGLQLSNDATLTLVQHLEQYEDSEHLLVMIDQIIEAVQKQDLKTPQVSGEVLEAALEECGTSTSLDADNALILIDAFSIPQFVYNPSQRKFIPVPMESLSLFPSAEMKAKLFRERYNLLHQRTLRHKLFSPPVLGGQSVPKFKLSTVERLLSSSGLDDKLIVLGMLSQMKEGKFHLEDTTGAVELDLSQCVFQTGMFVESSIVLAEGIYNDGVFHVGGIGLPPIESAKEFRDYFGSVNFFGGPSVVCASSSIKYQGMMDQHVSSTIVILSDLFLDDKKVLAKLGQLFSGFLGVPPIAFIFMGDFSSKPYGPDKNKRFKEGFKELSDLMLGYPALMEKSLFYFVPGPMDPGPGKVSPRPPIPSTLVSDVANRIPNAHFTSNPCRLQFCTREIVIYRNDILNKVSRHCITFPTEGTDMCHHFARSVLSQAHLCPLPIHSSPTYWMYDHAFRLYPPPDLVVIGDKCDPYSVELDDCFLTNPGSFSKNGFEFKVYQAHAGTVEESRIVLN